MQDATKDIQKTEAKGPEGAERMRARTVYTPAVDILERKEEIIVIADVPGVDENALDITLEKNELTIYGKVDTPMPGNYRPALSEYGVGDYQRVFTITEEIDREKITATVKHGVLTLVLPKAIAAKSRKIAVNA